MNKVKFYWFWGFILVFLLALVIFTFLKKDKLLCKSHDLTLRDSINLYDSDNLEQITEDKKMDSISLADSLAHSEIFIPKIKDSILAIINIFDKQSLHIKNAEPTITSDSLPLLIDKDKSTPDTFGANDPNNETGKLTSHIDAYLKINDISTCDQITREYQCIGTRNQFNFGEKVFITFYVECRPLFQDNKYVIKWKQDRTLIKPDRNVKTDVILLDYHCSVDSSGKYKTPVFNSFDSNDLDVPGKYSAIITVYNKSIKNSDTIDFIVH